MLATEDDDELFELEERINSLRTDLSSYGQEITQYITCLYTNSFPGKHFDLKKAENPFNVLKVLKQEVSDILVQSKVRTEFLRQVITICYVCIQKLF